MAWGLLPNLTLPLALLRLLVGLGVVAALFRGRSLARARSPWA
ncbi:hypothetical protein ACFOUS_23120 [Deinococcus metalli]